jgi:hypothetical protein
MDKFEDVLEGVPYEILITERSMNNIEGFSLSEFILDYNELLFNGLSISTRIDSILKIQKSHFVSCWFSQQRESMAMWNLYSNSDSVAIKIPFGKLKEFYKPDLQNIENVEYYCGRVSYQDFRTINQNSIYKLSELGNIGLRKDLSFSHEAEVRFIVKKNNTKDEIIGIDSLPLDFNDVDLKVISHPKMSEWKKENIKSLLKSKSLNNVFSKSEIKLRF